MWKSITCAALLCATTAAVLPVAFGADEAGQPAAGQQTLAEMDRTFATKAYMGNMAEVKMGELAAKQGSSDQVKKFGQRMVDDHGAAQKDLEKIMKDASVTPATDLDKQHQDTYDRLSKLQGDQFDKQYINTMVEDHNKDVAEYEKATKECKNEALKAYATKTLAVIQEHQKQAKDIQKGLTGTASENEK